MDSYDEDAVFAFDNGAENLFCRLFLAVKSVKTPLTELTKDGVSLAPIVTNNLQYAMYCRTADEKKKKRFSVSTVLFSFYFLFWYYIFINYSFILLLSFIVHYFSFLSFIFGFYILFLRGRIFFFLFWKSSLLFIFTNYFSSTLS